MNNTLCLIPAKGCSTRLPGKNLLPLGGKPLIARTIQKALNSNCFKTVCVSTEDEEVADVARNHGAEVPFLRPENLSHDPATIVDVMLHAIEYYKSNGEVYEKLCVLLPTTPFVTIDDILTAMDLLENCDESVLLSVTNTEFPPYNSWLVEEESGHSILAPCFPDSPYAYTKSTECPQTYRSNGAVIIVSVDEFYKNMGYKGMNKVPYVMPMNRSLDIDTKEDYLYAEFLHKSGLYIE